jgi:glycosyltransferase involved in cell wall biosynthesis
VPIAVTRTDTPPRVVLVRGQQLNPWDAAQYVPLAGRFDVVALHTPSNWFAVGEVHLPLVPVRTRRDRLPKGRVGDLLTDRFVNRYERPEAVLSDAAIVHPQELTTWYSRQTALLKPELGFKLVVTVWETLPFGEAFRPATVHPWRRAVLEQTDLFLPTTQRAAATLSLEGVDDHRIRVCEPGIADRFGDGAEGVTPDDPPLLLSAGRLVWEKGHQDVLRALARMHATGRGPRPRLMIVGEGPEREALAAHARELGLGDSVEFAGFVPHEAMPALLARASCLVLASLATRTWEEQFGMVLAEAMRADLPIVATDSGAISEVCSDAARLVPPGDWRALGAAIGTAIDGDRGALSAARRRQAERYTASAAADRLAAAYDSVLAT